MKSKPKTGFSGKCKVKINNLKWTFYFVFSYSNKENRTGIKIKEEKIADAHSGRKKPHLIRSSDAVSSNSQF